MDAASRLISAALIGAIILILAVASQREHACDPFPPVPSYECAR